MEKDHSQCPEFGFRLNHHEQNAKMKSKQNFNEVNGFPKKTERRRTETMNLAFATLREHIPNVPTDTKLSKIKTLRLAISYIRYLREVLDGEDPGEYVVDLKRDRNIAMGIADQYDYEEKQKKEVVSSIGFISTGNASRKFVHISSVYKVSSWHRSWNFA